MCEDEAASVDRYDGRRAVHVYALSVDELLRLARSLVTRELTDQEWRQYLHVDRCSAA
jgi:hypothetical protein